MLELIYYAIQDIKGLTQKKSQMNECKFAFLPLIAMIIIELIWSRTPMFSRNLALCICICGMPYCHAVLRLAIGIVFNVIYVYIHNKLTLYKYM